MKRTTKEQLGNYITNQVHSTGLHQSLVPAAVEHGTVHREQPAVLNERQRPQCCAVYRSTVQQCWVCSHLFVGKGPESREFFPPSQLITINYMYSTLV